MGSFNLNCTITGVTISPGDDIVIIPLMPSNGISDKPHVIQSGVSLYSTVDYFQPFCLPLFGEYDDYGSIENIREDENTAAIEGFFGMPISDFAYSLSSGREFWSSLHPMAEHYGVEGFYNMPYRTPYDAELFSKVGFVETSPSHLTLQNGDETINMILKEEEDGVRYTLIGADGNPLSTGRLDHSFDRFLSDFYDHTGIMLNIRPEHQKQALVLSKLSAMVLHREAFDLIAGPERGKTCPPYEEQLKRIDKAKDILKMLGDGASDDMKEMFDPFTGVQSLTGMRRGFLETQESLGVYKNALLDKRMQDDFTLFWDFHKNLVRYSKAYIQSFCGPQEGDAERTKALLEVSMRLNERVFSQYEDE